MVKISPDSYVAIPGLIVVYTFVFFGIDSIFIRF